jgi:hypothetical protein
VFITAVPITKLFAWGHVCVCVFITAGPSTKLFTWGGGMCVTPRTMRTNQGPGSYLRLIAEQEGVVCRTTGCMSGQDIDMLETLDGSHDGSPTAPAAPHRDPAAGCSAAAAVRGSAAPSRRVHALCPLPRQTSSGNAATTRPSPPPRLSHFECANAARNCAENFGEQQAREWLEHRDLALSEMCLKGTPLLKSLLFESLPLWMSGPLCVLVEGPLAASNRGLHFFHGCTLAKLPAQVLYFVLRLAFLDSQVQQRPPPPLQQRCCLFLKIRA